MSRGFNSVMEVCAVDRNGDGPVTRSLLIARTRRRGIARQMGRASTKYRFAPNNRLRGNSLTDGVRGGGVDRMSRPWSASGRAFFFSSFGEGNAACRRRVSSTVRLREIQAAACN